MHSFSFLSVDQQPANHFLWTRSFSASLLSNSVNRISVLHTKFYFHAFQWFSVSHSIFILFSRTHGTCTYQSTHILVEMSLVTVIYWHFLNFAAQKYNRHPLATSVIRAASWQADLRFTIYRSDFQFYCFRDLDLIQWLILKLGLDILKMYLHINNEVSE